MNMFPRFTTYAPLIGATYRTISIEVASVENIILRQATPQWSFPTLASRQLRLA
jgi:hypothetical protein